MSLLGKIVGGVLNVATGGLGGVAGQVAGILAGKPKKPPVDSATSPFPVLTQKPDSVVTTGGGLTFPTPFGPVTAGGSKSTTYFPTRTKARKKYRRMNAANPRALTRAIKRVDRFQDLARMVGFSRAPAKMRGVHFPKRKRTTKCR